MPPPRPTSAPPASGLDASASRKSDANRSSSAGQPTASAERASAAMSTRLSRITASPRVARRATRSAAPRRSIHWPAASRGAVAGRAHAPLLDEAPHPAGGLGLQIGPGARRHASGDDQLRVAVAQDGADPLQVGTSRARPRGPAAFSRKAATTPSSTRMPGSWVASCSRARSSGVSTSKRDQRSADRSRDTKPAASRRRTAALSVGQSPGHSARRPRPRRRRTHRR